MKVLKEIFKRPITIIFTIIIMMVIGVISTSSMAINLIPDIAFPYLTIQTIYAGADAQTIDKSVTEVLEKNLSTLSGIHSLDTYSLDNASLLLLQFDYGTNTDEKEEEIKKRLSSITLPSDCGEPVISNIDLNNSTSIVSLTLYSETEDIEEVSKKAYELEQQIMSIKGVGNTQLTGASSKEIKVEMINGLEMLAGLIVQQLKIDASYDIPLGSIEVNNESITINNATSAKTIEAIQNLPISIDLSSEQLTSISEAQQMISSLENINSQTVLNLKNEATDVLSAIEKLESSSPEELDNLVAVLPLFKTITNIVENYSVSTLNFIWETALKRLLESDSFKNMTDDELMQLANTLSISYDILKWLQNNAEINPATNETYAEEKWQIIINFKVQNPEVQIEDYPALFYELGIVSNNVYDENYMSEKEICDMINFSYVVNSVSLNSVVTTLKNGEKPTNAQYANLFAISGVESGFILNESMIALIRQDNFLSAIDIFYNYKLNHEHEEILDNGTTQVVGDPIPSQDFIDLYNEMNLDLISIKPTARLLDFIRDIDTSSTSLRFTVSSVADVVLSSKNDSYAFYNSKRAIQIDIYSTSGSNATSIAKEVQEVINNYNDEGNDIKVVMLKNQTDFINDSLSNALVSLIIGMVLAVLVIYVFLRRVPSSLIIAVSMPLSILCTLACLYLMGITLNMVSVGGLAVGIGMLVDNSIVVLESITSERAKGKSVFEASVDGVKLVLGSLIGSTLTSICVFFPILFINGLTKEVFADLSWAVIFSLSFSLLIAVLVIPTLFCLFYKNKKEETMEKNEGKVFTKIKARYIKILTKVLQHKKATILVSMGVFALSLGLIFTCNIEFLPSIDQHLVQMTINFETGDDSNYCKDKTNEAYQVIANNIEDVEYISQSVGLSGLVQQSQKGTLLIKLEENAKSSTEVVEDIRNVLETNNFDTRYEIQAIDGIIASFTGGMNGISMTIYGDDVDVLKEISDQIQQDVMTKKGIRHTSDNMLNNVSTYTIKFNKDSLVNYNLDYEVVVQTLRVGLAGYDVCNLEIDGNEIGVIVSWKDDTIGNYYDSIETLMVGLNNEMEPIYLQDVASIELDNGRNVIRKSNGRNVLEISVEAYGIDTNTASKYLKESTDKVLKQYVGYESQASGVSYYLTDAFSGLVVALIISFFLLFGVMACLFESLRKPLIIIFAFPFAFTGAFIALAISRISLNVVSFIGLIMLMGVIINDAIVLNERIDQLKESCLSKQDAVINGCKDRLRAVLMTTLTTVLALIPMALGLGKGGALMQPLGVVAIGGMVLGTLVTLILIPSVYSLTYKIDFKSENKNSKKVRNRKLKRKNCVR